MTKKIYNPFQFKKFSITQNNAAMKIGTDGILIGAWANSSESTKALDIGSGTGIISIMIAQRFEKIKIDSIEISKNAIIDAKENIKNCQWKNRINLIKKDFKKFTTNKKYDLIVSNPPFFINSLKPIDKERSNARHKESLSYQDILEFSIDHLIPKGSLNMILPYIQNEIVIKSAKQVGLHLKRKCIVSPKPNKDPHRILFEFSKTNCETINERLIIEEFGRHQYSKDYKKLTREFYTIFD